MIELNDLIGKPFGDKGRGPDYYDCYGLTMEIYRRFGKSIPNYSISAEACVEITSAIQTAKQNDVWKKLDSLQIPCIVLIKANIQFTQHFGVVINRMQFMHIRNYGVCVERLDSPLWKRKIEGFYDYIG